jgi:short-subunit dehydrogenase
MYDFSGKVAVVTGASKGIGFGISEMFARNGAKVYLVARTEETLKAAEQKIRAAGGKAHSFTADITNFDQIKKVIDQIYINEGAIDIFVNNAGTYKAVTFDSSPDEIKHMVALDMLAPLLISHYLIQKAKALPDATLQLLTVASQAALKTLPNGLGYGTAKKGLASGLFEFEQQLLEENIQNVKLYRVYPGTVGTEDVMKLVHQGVLQNPTSLESVIDTVHDLLAGRTPTRDAYVGFVPGEGIKRVYYDFDVRKFSMLQEHSTVIVDKEFDLKK